MRRRCPKTWSFALVQVESTFEIVTVTVTRTATMVAEIDVAADVARVKP
jgi:hypothetical protein